MTKGAHISRHFHFWALALFFLLGGAPLGLLMMVESFSASTTRKPPTTTSRATIQEQELRIFQSQVSGPLANSFEPSTFNPFPLLSNPHLQTIVATLLRNIPEINYLYSIPHTLVGIVSSSLENKKTTRTFGMQENDSIHPMAISFTWITNYIHNNNNNKRDGWYCVMAWNPIRIPI